MNYLTKMMSTFQERFPGCWQSVEKIRASHNNGLGQWPSYCYLPFLHCAPLIIGGKKLSTQELANTGADVCLLAALASWRVTQRVYRFDNELFQELWETPVDHVPPEIFRKMPDWCIYIPLPDEWYSGVFVQIDRNLVENRDELKVVLVKPGATGASSNDFYCMGVDLTQKDIMSGLESTLRETMRNIQQRGFSVEIQIPAEALLRIRRVISLVLYLCSVNADYERAEPPATKRTKKGLRIFTPHTPTVIEVGMRVGAALRHARQSMESDNSEESGISRRPHVRRAHYHHYWIGAKEERELIVKWLPPILVNIDKGDIETTIRPVTA
jgi:hypothetical protein